MKIWSDILVKGFYGISKEKFPSLPLVLTAFGAVAMFIMCILRCVSRDGFPAWVLIFPTIASIGYLAQLGASYVKVKNGKNIEVKDVRNLMTGFLATVAVVFGSILYMVW